MFQSLKLIRIELLGGDCGLCGQNGSLAENRVADLDTIVWDLSTFLRCQEIYGEVILPSEAGNIPDIFGDLAKKNLDRKPRTLSPAFEGIFGGPAPSW